jgi:hypothetical protein
MGMETLLEGYRSLLLVLYAPQNYYRRIRIFLQEYQRPAVCPKPTLQRQRAFIRSLLRLRMLDKE